ncbi:MAG: tail fiber domain-containing protein [Acidobacteriota bacterium]
MCRALLFISFLVIVAGSAFSQSSIFTYQGKLTESGMQANGQYDLVFRLFDGGGSQIGGDLTKEDVQVTSGIFTVALDFGASPFTGGTGESLEIAVRLGSSTGAFSTLTPRQPLTSSPYAIKSSSASSADIASDALKLGGVASGQYVVTSDSRLADARTPTPGSSSYIQNSTSTQGLSNFDISGNGTAGGTLSGSVVNAGTQFNLNGSRFVAFGPNNTYVGFGAGQSAAGFRNAYFGTSAGSSLATGNFNSMFGAFAGNAQTSGDSNAYFGDGAGFFQQTGSSNSYFGSGAGANNRTGIENSFVGANAGNSFAGSQNTAVGVSSGQQGTSAPNGSNSFFGAFSGGSDFPNVSNGTAIGSRAFVTQSNSLVLGSINGVNGSTADTNVGIGTTAPSTRLHVVGNQIISGNLDVGGTISGNFAGTINNALSLGGVPASQYVITTDPRMTDTRTPAAGSLNYIQNTTTQQTSNFNITGNGTAGGTVSANVINAASQFNIDGNRILASFIFPVDSLYVGFNSGGTFSGSSNSFFGGFTGQNNFGSSNTFIGDRTGFNNTSGSLNSFVGLASGSNSTTGNSNSYFGINTGISNITGSANTIIGSNANLGSGSLTNATAIGANALVSQNNSLVLGSINGVNNASADTNVGIGTATPSQRLDVFGDVRVGTGSTGCITNRSGSVIAGTCSSDLRFKKNVVPFGNLLRQVTNLRPVYFDWRSSEFKDRNFGTGRAYGLIAQEVEKALPELVVTDEAGYKAVNYSLLPLMTIEAVREQQMQLDAQGKLIESQQQQITELRTLVKRLAKTPNGRTRKR